MDIAKITGDFDDRSPEELKTALLRKLSAWAQEMAPRADEDEHI